MVRGAVKDPQEATLRRKLRALERKYDAVVERGRLNGGLYSVSHRLKTLGQQIDVAQKALDDYLAKRPAS